MQGEHSGVGVALLACSPPRLHVLLDMCGRVHRKLALHRRRQLPFLPIGAVLVDASPNFKVQSIHEIIHDPVVHGQVAGPKVLDRDIEKLLENRAGGVNIGLRASKDKFPKRKCRCVCEPMRCPSRKYSAPMSTLPP